MRVVVAPAPALAEQGAEEADIPVIEFAEVAAIAGVATTTEVDNRTKEKVAAIVDKSLEQITAAAPTENAAGRSTKLLPSHPSLTSLYPISYGSLCT